jgi:hypothetical protein
LEDPVGRTVRTGRAPDRGGAPLAQGTVRLFALLTGLTVANLYYHQPLLA